MPRTAFNRQDFGPGNGFQRFARLLADLLRARMTRDVIRHLAERVGEFGLQQPVAAPRHQVFERLEHRVAHRLDVRGRPGT
jgi:hypothetical protein